MILAARPPRLIALVLTVAFASLFAVGGGTALAAEFTVNSTADWTECAVTCTLRGAIAAAEATAGVNTILLPAGTFELGAFEQAHPASTGQLRLNDAAGETIKIVGQGVGQTIIDAAKHDRVLRVSGGGTDVLQGITLEDGYPSGLDGELEESVRGAGILQIGGTLQLNRVRVTENEDAGYAGGIDVESHGTLELHESELDNNIATSGGGGAVNLEPGALIATDSSFDGDNSLAGQGGALQLLNGSTAALTNDTFAQDGFLHSGDTYEGGSVYMQGSTATFLNVTFSDDAALGNGNGGADISANEGSHVSLQNVLLGAGTGGEPGEQACNERYNTPISTWIDHGGNLSSDTSCMLAVADMGVDLELGELGSYGGSTQTVRLLEGSPAIDSGVTGCPATDQREYARVGTCDSGAFEFGAAAPKTEESGGSPGGPAGSQTATTGISTTTTIATPPTITPASGVASTPQAIEELLLGCGKRSLALNDVLISGTHVVLDGSAAKSLVGKKVKILFDDKKRVATAVVKANGQFSSTAPLPPARLRRGNSARYMAESGKERSLNLELTRRLILQSPTFSGGAVTLTGQVVAPLGKPVGAVTVEQQLQCGNSAKVLSFTPPGSGRFHVTINGIPADAKAGVYRLTTSVLDSPHSHHAVPTFSLALPVPLG